MNVPIWRVLAASVRGTSHQQNNTPCQDAHAYHVLPAGGLVIVVADGAGSAERSAAGAQWVAHQTAAGLAAALTERQPDSESAWQAILIEGLNQAIQALNDLAARENAPLRSFAATLLCAVIAEGWLAVGHMGSDSLVVVDADGLLTLVARPQQGEYANETYFLTMPDAIQHAEISVCRQEVQALAALSDGLVRLALRLPEQAPHPQFFNPLWNFAADAAQSDEQLATFLASERVCARTDDDKTLVLAVRLDPRSPDAATPT